MSGSSFVWSGWRSHIQGVSYLHVFCSSSSCGHSLAPPSYSSPRNLPSQSLHWAPRTNIISPPPARSLTSTWFGSLRRTNRLCLMWGASSGKIVTAQHSMFLRGQTGGDVYVTCTASWLGHASGLPSITLFSFFLFAINIVIFLRAECDI